MPFNSVDDELGREEEQRQANLQAMRQQEQQNLRAAQQEQQSNLQKATPSFPPNANAAINNVTQKASKRALYWAYGALFTLVGTIPAFIYLNLHLWKSRKGGTRFFAPLQKWDKAAIILLDMAVMFVGLMIPVITIGATIAYCNTWTGWGVSKVSGAVGIGDFCAALKIDDSVMAVANDGSVNNTDCVGITDAAARQRLASANITVNQLEPITSLKCIEEPVLAEVISFKADCDAWASTRGPCTVVVTGGTETTGGHAGGPCSHISGDKIDIRSQGTPGEELVTQYIRENFTRAGNRGSHPRWSRPSTSVHYYDEGNHWDIGGIGCG